MEDRALSEGDKRLQKIRETFPEWDVFQVFGGYLAVPKDIPVVQSIDVDGVAEKIRHTEAQQ